MRVFVNSQSGLGRTVGLGDFGRANGPLGNLGLWNSSWCDSFEQAVETLGEVVRRGKAEGLIHPALAQAESVLNSETSLLPLNRTPVGPTNCEAQTSRIAVLINSVNALLKNKVVVPPSVRAQLTDAEQGTLPPEDMPLWTKAAIVGGISVVGLIALAVITGQVAPIFRTIKKVI